MGNGVPEYMPDLPLRIAHVAHMDKNHTLKNYKFQAKDPYTCGNYIADKLGFNLKKIAENGGSNERIFRKILTTQLKNSVVLIGLAIKEECQIRTVMQIIYMQRFLKTENIPYLIYNAMSNGFDKPLTKECELLLNKIDKNHFYNLQGSYDECQHGWCVKEKLHVSDEDEHPNLKGHLAWGEKLLTMAKKVLV